MTTELNTELTEQALKHISDAENAYQNATVLVVSNQDEYETAGDIIAGLKKWKGDLETERKSLVKPLNDVVKKLNAKFKPHTDKIDLSIKQVNSKMTEFFRIEEKKRLDAEAKAAEKARKEQDKINERARKQAEKGNHEKAEALQEQALNVQPKAVEPTANKQTSKTTMVTTWKAQVYDKLALIEAVAKGDASMELLEVNQSALNKLASAQKDSMNLPGVKAISNQNIRSK